MSRLFSVAGLLAIGWIAISIRTADGQCDPTWNPALGNPGVNIGYIDPIVSWNDGTGEKLYAGGSATGIGGNALNNFLAEYDPQSEVWSRLGTGIDQGTTNAFLTMLLPWDDGTGEKLYVTGQFASAGGLTAANSFAVWDGNAWSDAGAGFTQASLRVTYDMLPADLGDGEMLYLGGNWTEIGGQAVGGVARFDGKSFSAWGTGVGFTNLGGFSPLVNDLEAWDDGSGPAIYACGRFNGLDDAATANIARFNVKDNVWEAFGQALVPTSATQSLFAFAVFDDGNGEALYVAGGSFRISGDDTIYRAAKWNGGNWSGVGQTLSGTVFDLEVWNDGNGPALYLCGSGLVDVNYFARLVNGNWEAAESGVNNPSVTGGNASAFGMYVWNGDMVVGGTFTQVGGLDPMTGNGSGTPIPARGLAVLEACNSVLLGDVNLDGVVDLLDVSAFVDRLTSGLFQAEADINQDGVVDLLDVSPFVALLVG